MKVLRGSIDKMRIEKVRMAVIPACLNILFISGYSGSRAFPRARFRSSGTVVKVVIDIHWRLVAFDFRLVQRDKAAGPRINDVVRKNIVRHVPLHLELTG